MSKQHSALSICHVGLLSFSRCFLSQSLVIWSFFGYVGVAAAINGEGYLPSPLNTPEIPQTTTFQFQHPSTLPASTIVDGCNVSLCNIDLGWQNRTLLVPAGGVAVFHNVVLENTTFRFIAGQYDDVFQLPKDLLLPVAFVLGESANITLINVTAFTDCSSVEQLAEVLQGSLMVYQTTLDNSPENLTMQQQQLLWQHSFQVLPEMVHVESWNTSQVIATNFTITCRVQTGESLAKTNSLIPLATGTATSAVAFRKLLEDLPSYAPCIVISIQANVSLEDAGAWSASLGPAVIAVNMSWVGLPWTELVFDLADRVGVFKIQGNPSLYLQNLVFINNPLGPSEYAPWNYIPTLLFPFVPFRSRVMSRFGLPGTNAPVVLRNCVTEGLTDLWWYMMAWGAKAANGQYNFVSMMLDEVSAAANRGIGITFGAMMYFLKSDTCRFYYGSLRLGPARHYPALRNSSGILPLTDNQAVPLEAVGIVRDVQDLALHAVRLLYSNHSNVALWVMNPLQVTPAQLNYSMKFTGPLYTKALLVVGYSGSEVFDLDNHKEFTMLPFIPVLHASGLILLNVPTKLSWNNSDFSMLQSSARLLLRNTGSLACSSVAFVVTPDEVLFLRAWGQQLFGVKPWASPDGSTLVYTVLRAFGYSGRNITVTSKCVYGFECRHTNITYQQLVSTYIGNVTIDEVDQLLNESMSYQPVVALLPPPTVPSPVGGVAEPDSVSGGGLSEAALVAVIVSCVVGGVLLLMLAGAGLWAVTAGKRRSHLPSSPVKSGSSAAWFLLRPKSSTCGVTSNDDSANTGVPLSVSLFSSSATIACDERTCTPPAPAPPSAAQSDSFPPPGCSGLILVGMPGGGMTRIAEEAHNESLRVVWVHDMLNSTQEVLLDLTSNMPSNLAQIASVDHRAIQRSVMKDGKQLVSDMVSKLTSIEDKNLYIQELLGRGGTASVYKATWRGLTVAVKTLLLPGGETQMLEKAAQEVAMLLKLHHPNLVAMYSYQVRALSTVDGPCRIDSLSISGPNLAACSQSSVGVAVNSATAADLKVFIIQEYCSGGTLQAAIDAGALRCNTPGQLSPAALAAALDIARGMAYVHARSMVHGDLTPNNVLLNSTATDDGLTEVEAKVSDFGLAVTLSSDQTHVTRSVQGTKPYIAPEVFILGCTSKPADVYAFGIILWELVHGTPPWRLERYSTNKESPNMQLLKAESAVFLPALYAGPAHLPTSSGDDDFAFHMPAVPPLDPRCPPSLASLIASCTALNAGARPCFEVVSTAL